jgi:hypothetical protein
MRQPSVCEVNLTPLGITDRRERHCASINTACTVTSLGDPCDARTLVRLLARSIARRNMSPTSGGCRVLLLVRLAERLDGSAIDGTVHRSHWKV